MRIGVVQGPNLNLLGVREPEIYGHETLDALNTRIGAAAAELGAEVEIFQANGEGALIDFVQDAAARVDGFIVNAGGYTHTSVALLDALVGVGKPYVEVHLSNLAGREPYRRTSLLAPKASGVIMGFGAPGYILAVRGLISLLRARSG